MKKLYLLLAIFLIVPSVEIKAEEPIDVCQLIVDEEGEILNIEEYQKCLEDNGYGVEPLQGKWGDPDA